VSWENSHAGRIDFCRCLLCGWWLVQPRRGLVIKKRHKIEPDPIERAIIKAGRLSGLLAGISDEIMMKRRACYCDE
jgi:hypothetical protein